MNVQNLRAAAHAAVPEIPRSAREWLQILAKYRDPNPARSVFELAVTLGPFLLIWTVAIWVLQYSAIAALVLGAINGLFLVRLFCIQHDCGHASFFTNRPLSDWIGRSLGVLTLTPYHVWRRQHAIHHSASGNLDLRGIGDVTTLTVEEYLARSRFGRFMYRIYRSPLTLFVIGPAYIFLIQNRIPYGLMKSGASFWLSCMGTNLTLLVGMVALVYFGGWAPLFLVVLPSWIVAASTGVWLFYVQHQFEDTHWRKAEDWQLHEAALEGSSHYVLPRPLQWLSANIGIHHVHHLYSRIPFYRLTEVIRDHPILAESQRMTIGQSISCARLHLWDESQKKLLSFRRAHAMYLTA
ncbi:fatty acid desaturase [Pseudorhodobacter sp.]|uniref:fatty acid desaturase n=1 Tax=Pseudorhodobacter sp. TaxID=1934400 RepID=UPI00264812FC|nr:fatty acid desaturase [Pseudorhodobacter sp.]MDN5785787.1 fatty acid desaturase [Pseudorhodobacter sp.]